MRNDSYKQFRDKMIKTARQKKFPLLTHFELTARCNLDCKMCYVHTQDNATALRGELSTEQWKYIFDQAYSAGMQYAYLSGGECLIRKDFKELYRHLWDKHVYITVLSNGTMLDDEYIEFFQTYRPDMIQISLYGSSEDNYLRVTGHKGFNKTIYAIDNLEQAGIDVRVVTTPNKYMGDDYFEIIKLCKERKYMFTEGNISLMPNRDDPTKNDYYLSNDEVVDLYIRRTQLKRALVPVDPTPECYGPMTTVPDKGLVCNAGTCSALISWDGNMYPCAAIMENGMSVIDCGFNVAWNNTMLTASQVSQGIECVGCAYESVCPKCPAYRLKDLHSGHCNPAVCNMYRKLVAAGVKKLKT